MDYLVSCMPRVTVFDLVLLENYAGEILTKEDLDLL